MAVPGSGVGGSLGVAATLTYGTYVTPDRHIRIEQAPLKKINTIAQGGGLAAGIHADPGAQRVITSTAAAGTLGPYVITNKKMGLLINMLMGGTATVTQQGGSAAYLQSHPLADPKGKFFACQLGIPTTDGVVNHYDYPSLKVTGAEFSCGQNDILTVTLDVYGLAPVETQTFTTPSYTASMRPFHFAQMGLKTGTYGSETAANGVKRVTVKIERSLYEDPFYANGLGVGVEPVLNGKPVISGTIETDFVTKAAFADLFAAGTSTALLWEFTGPVVATTTYAEAFRIKIPQIFFNEGTPTLDGPGVVSPSFPFVAQYDETNVDATIEYMAGDSAV